MVTAEQDKKDACRGGQEHQACLREGIWVKQPTALSLIADLVLRCLTY